MSARAPQVGEDPEATILQDLGVDTEVPPLEPLLTESPTTNGSIMTLPPAGVAAARAPLNGESDSSEEPSNDSSPPSETESAGSTDDSASRPPILRRTQSSIINGHANRNNHSKHLRFTAASLSMTNQTSEVIFPGGDGTIERRLRRKRGFRARTEYYISEPGTPNLSET